MKKKYFIKLKFTKHNGEIVYGTRTIDAEEKAVIDEFSEGSVSFAICEDCGGAEIFLPIKDVFTITEISNNEYKILEKLGLIEYGALEYWTVEDIIYTNTNDEEEVDELRFLGPPEDFDEDDMYGDDDDDYDDED